MWQLVQNACAKLETFMHRRKIARALALHRRREVRRDGLDLISMCNSLRVEWRARDVHPWDRDDSDDRKREALVTQTLADTYAAVSRLFAALPQIDILEVWVLERGSETPILAGTVDRSSLIDLPEALSLGMKLSRLGIVYHSAGLQFESLAEHRASADLSWAERNPQFATLYKKL